jgi:hypothetical protein
MDTSDSLQEMNLLWETIQAQPDNNEVLSNSAALIVNSLRTQFYIQEQVVDFTLKVHRTQNHCMTNSDRSSTLRVKVRWPC